MPDATSGKKKPSDLERARLELADTKAGIPSHQHTPRDGSAPFRCTSPYCTDLGAPEPWPAPGLDPANDAFTQHYRRD